MQEKLNNERSKINQMFRKGTCRSLVLEYFQEYEHDMGLNAKFRRILKSWIYKRYI